MRTMWEALKLCLPITFMSFAIFTRSDIVVHPGWAQVLATLLVTISTCGVTCAIFGRFTDHRGTNIMLRAALALASLAVMLHPDGNVALAMAVFVLPATIIGVRRHRRIAPPKTGLQSQPVG